MNQDLHTHLEKLKLELSKLEPAVKHLQKADKNANELILAVSNIHKEHRVHLSNIENSLININDEHQKSLIKEIQNSTKKLENATEKFSNSNDGFKKQIRILIEDYKGLKQSTENLINKIESVDFPTRLDKIDATVSSINQGLQNIQTRLGDIERNVKDDIQASSKDIISIMDSNVIDLRKRIDDFENETVSNFDKQTKNNKILKILFVISIFLAGGSAALIIMYIV